jgi:hypothetical protein
MADYDEQGNVIPPPDAQAAREDSLTPETVLYDETHPVDTGMAAEVVTIMGPSLNPLLVLGLMIGALWYFSSGTRHYED